MPLLNIDPSALLDKFPSIVLPTFLSRVKQATIKEHLVRLTIKVHDLLWQAP
jgi:hypothetical protein